MGRMTAKVIGVLAMSNETPENKAKRAANLREQADAAEAKSHELDAEGDGAGAIALRAQAVRQRDTAKLVEPKKSTKARRSSKPDS